MSKLNPITKQAVIVQAKRIIEILENTPEDHLDGSQYYCKNSLKSELKTKMKELRRDTIRLEKELYPKY